jgi:hypothetical protein
VGRTRERFAVPEALLLRHRVLLTLRPVVRDRRAGRHRHAPDEGDVALDGHTNGELEAPGLLPDGGVGLGGGVGDGELCDDGLLAPVVYLVRGHHAGVGHHLSVPLAPPDYIKLVFTQTSAILANNGPKSELASKEIRFLFYKYRITQS